MRNHTQVKGCQNLKSRLLQSQVLCPVVKEVILMAFHLLGALRVTLEALGSQLPSSEGKRRAWMLDQGCLGSNPSVAV